jgi:hypothetical protein
VGGKIRKEGRMGGRKGGREKGRKEGKKWGRRISPVHIWSLRDKNSEDGYVH